jgi:peptidoglycan/LPS O-acetylase OafA/YrhL
VAGEKILRRKSVRNHQFDLLRILLATLVLLSHAPEITDGNVSRELFHRLTHAPMTFVLLGVDVFFVLSRYLIVQSWLGDPELLNFFRKRVLRIVPGYLVAVVASTVAVACSLLEFLFFFGTSTFNLSKALLFSARRRRLQCFPDTRMLWSTARFTPSVTNSDATYWLRSSGYAAYTGART